MQGKCCTNFSGFKVKIFFKMWVKDKDELKFLKVEGI